MTKLLSEHKHVLKLVDRDRGDDGWTPVSDVLYPHLSKIMSGELVVFDGAEGNYRAKLTDEGAAIVYAMAYL